MSLRLKKGFHKDHGFYKSTFNPARMWSLGQTGAGTPNYEQDVATESMAAKATAKGLEPLSYIYDCLVDGETLWHPILGFNEHKEVGPGPLGMYTDTPPTDGHADASNWRDDVASPTREVQQRYSLGPPPSRIPLII